MKSRASFKIKTSFPSRPVMSAAQVAVVSRPSRGERVSNTMRYQVISPDQLPINDKIYPDEQSASHGLSEWLTRFERQGYYKDANCERIPLDQVRSRCAIQALPEPTPIEREHYQKLVGKTVVGIEWQDCNGEAMPILLMECDGQDKVGVCVLRDAEGNGTGFLDICEVE
jgi:hypothetical protein